MTAKEARAVADAKRSVTNSTTYKLIQKSIEENASRGWYYTTISFPNYITRTDSNGIVTFIQIEDELKKVTKLLKAEGFDIQVEQSFTSGCDFDIKIDWSKEYNNNEADSI